MDLYDIAIAKKLSGGSGGGGGSSDFSNWIKCEVTQDMVGDSKVLKLNKTFTEINNTNIYYFIPSTSDAEYIGLNDKADKIIALLFVDIEEDSGFAYGYAVDRVSGDPGLVGDKLFSAEESDLNVNINLYSEK